jgi:hypothetical protein
MRLKLIACNVFMREACFCVARSPHVIDVEFTELGDHIHSETLRGMLQARIDAVEASGKKYDAIVLLFGLCGNATVGLQARTMPLVIPRAHDCCTILLGSKDAFRTYFSDNPSRPFSSAGYLERGDYYMRVEDGENRMHYGDAYAAYVEQYGEENAKYIWETMHPAHVEIDQQAFFIEIPETAELGYAAQFKTRVEAEGKTCTVLPGSLEIVRKLLDGEWDEQVFLKVAAGRTVQGVYDWVEVIRSAAP